MIKSSACAIGIPGLLCVAASLSICLSTYIPYFLLICVFSHCVMLIIFRHLFHISQKLLVFFYSTKSFFLVWMIPSFFLSHRPWISHVVPSSHKTSNILPSNFFWPTQCPPWTPSISLICANWPKSVESLLCHDPFLCDCFDMATSRVCTMPWHPAGCLLRHGTLFSVGFAQALCWVLI